MCVAAFWAGCGSGPRAVLLEGEILAAPLLNFLVEGRFSHLLPGFPRQTEKQHAVLSLHLTRWRYLVVHCVGLCLAVCNQDLLRNSAVDFQMLLQIFNFPLGYTAPFAEDIWAARK